MSDFRPVPKPEKTPKKVKKRINPVSKKRQSENEKYKVLGPEFLAQPENQICPITGHQTTQVHHKYSGKDRGPHFLDTETWLAVSAEGHDWIHKNSGEAREKGYLY